MLTFILQVYDEKFMANKKAKILLSIQTEYRYTDIYTKTFDTFRNHLKTFRSRTLCKLFVKIIYTFRQFWSRNTLKQ